MLNAFQMFSILLVEIPKDPLTFILLLRFFFVKLSGHNNHILINYKTIYELKNRESKLKEYQKNERKQKIPSLK